MYYNNTSTILLRDQLYLHLVSEVQPVDEERIPLRHMIWDGDGAWHTRTPNCATNTYDSMAPEPSTYCYTSKIMIEGTTNKQAQAMLVSK